MHIRSSVRENRLSDPSSVGPSDYEPYVDSGCCWACEEQGIVIGFAALNAGGASIWALFVMPEAEGRGVGRALLGEAIAKARQLGLARITLGTAEGSRALGFYERSGWSRIGPGGRGEVQMLLEL